MNKKETLKQQILQLSREYYNEVHRDSKVFESGKKCKLWWSLWEC